MKTKKAFSQVAKAFFIVLILSVIAFLFVMGFLDPAIKRVTQAASSQVGSKAGVFIKSHADIDLLAEHVVARAGADQAICIDELVHLDASESTSAEDSEITAYYWDLNDADAENFILGKEQDTTYSSAGSYTATLKVIGSDDFISEDTVLISVHENCISDFSPQDDIYAGEFTININLPTNIDIASAKMHITGLEDNSGSFPNSLTVRIAESQFPAWSKINQEINSTEAIDLTDELIELIDAEKDAGVSSVEVPITFTLSQVGNLRIDRLSIPFEYTA